MDHAEALEHIEIAAAEPDGLERLMAGDKPDAAAVAGHLAGCPTCVAELAQIRRTAAIARDVIREQPDPALRERTLAFVRAVGRDRSGGVGEPAAGRTFAPPPVLAPPPIAISAAATRRPWLAWAAGLAAVLVVATGIGFAAGGASQSRHLEGREAEIGVLADATSTAIRVAAQPDARYLPLSATTGRASGSLLFSPASGELVMIATNLVPEAAGQEYGCWVEVDGQRRRIGRMYWAGDLWAWAGPTAGLADLPSGAVFGVSLGSAGGAGPADPVLTGRL